MKKYILYLTTALLLGAGLLTGSCSKDDAEGTPTDPVFPTPVTATIAAGETYTIDIEPNLDWEVRIPFSGDAAKWFYLQDDSQQAHKVQGRSGKHTITLCAQDQADYDSEHACDVTLKMWDSTGKEYSKVIATVKIGKFERALSFYSCLMDGGDFAWGGDGFTYSYEEQPTNEITLAWPEGRSGFMMPVLVDANFKWNVTSTLPEWISDLSVAGGDGTKKVEMRLTGNGMKYPLNGASATLDFGDGNQSYQLTVNIPPCHDIFITGFAAESKFNHKGQTYVSSNGDYQDGAAYGMITSAANLNYVIFVEVTQYGNTRLDYETDTSWLTLDDTWSDRGEVIQNRRLNISAAANDSDARKAIVMGIPASIAATVEPWQMLGGDYGNEIAEEYKKYIITTVNQSANPGPISPKYPEEMILVKAKMGKPENTWFMGQLGANNAFAYQLTYAETWSGDERESTLNLDVPYTDLAFFDYDLNNITDDSWLTVTNLPDNGGIRIQMNPRKDKFDYSGFGLPENYHEGYIRFTNEDGHYAVIQCVFDPNADFGGGGDTFEVAFTNPESVYGATLVQITADDPSNPLYVQWLEQISQGIPVYHLTYTTPEAYAPLTTSAFQQVMYAPWSTDWIYYEPQFGGSIQIYMDSPVKAEAAMQLCDSSYSIKCIIVCTLDIPDAK